MYLIGTEFEPFALTQRIIVILAFCFCKSVPRAGRGYSLGTNTTCEDPYDRIVRTRTCCISFLAHIQMLSLVSLEFLLRGSPVARNHCGHEDELTYAPLFF